MGCKFGLSVVKIAIRWLSKFLAAHPYHAHGTNIFLVLPPPPTLGATVKFLVFTWPWPAYQVDVHLFISKSLIRHAGNKTFYIKLIWRANVVHAWPVEVMCAASSHRAIDPGCLRLHCKSRHIAAFMALKTTCSHYHHNKISHFIGQASLILTQISHTNSLESNKCNIYLFC